MGVLRLHRNSIYLNINSLEAISVSTNSVERWAVNLTARFLPQHQPWAEAMFSSSSNTRARGRSSCRLWCCDMPRGIAFRICFPVTCLGSTLKELMRCSYSWFLGVWNKWGIWPYKFQSTGGTIFLCPVHILHNSPNFSEAFYTSLWMQMIWNLCSHIMSRSGCMLKWIWDASTQQISTHKVVCSVSPVQAGSEGYLHFFS